MAASETLINIFISFPQCVCCVTVCLWLFCKCWRCVMEFFAACMRWAILSPGPGILLPSSISETLRLSFRSSDTCHRVSSQSAVCFPSLLLQHKGWGLGLLFTNQPHIFFTSCTRSLVRFSFFKAETKFLWSLGKTPEWGNNIDAYIRTVNTVFFLPQTSNCSPSDILHAFYY